MTFVPTPKFVVKYLKEDRSEIPGLGFGFKVKPFFSFPFQEYVKIQYLAFNYLIVRYDCSDCKFHFIGHLLSGSEKIQESEFTIDDEETMEEILEWYYKRGHGPLGYPGGNSLIDNVSDKSKFIPTSATMMDLMKSCFYLDCDDCGIKYKLTNALAGYLFRMFGIEINIDLDFDEVYMSLSIWMSCSDSVEFEIDSVTKTLDMTQAETFFSWCYQQKIRPEIRG